MREDGKTQGAPPALGGASLLSAFAILCLTVFALLSLSTVRADQRLSLASAQAVSDYYKADAQAQEILARLRGGELPQEVTIDGDIYSYACPASDVQTLQVELRMEDGAYTILRWQMVPSAAWNVDDSIKVWNGE